MKNSLALFLAIFLCSLLNAQSIKGKISDEKEKPVKGAVVLLLLQKDSSLVSTALSAENGAYSFDNIKNGNYRVAIDMLGYQKIRNNITVSDNTVTIPEMKLVPHAVSLGEVTVVSSKPFLEQRADKLVVNVENTATAAGSTALEILQKVPGVMVVNDQVKLAGKSNVSIMIDGKISQYTDMSVMLSSMGAANIEKIELITNPGARYDATGGAIINIILKKNANLGTNGTASLSAGTGLYKKGEYGIDKNYYRVIPSLSLNHRKGKLNVYGSLNFLYRNSFNYSEFDRVIGPNRFFQANENPNTRNSNNYRAGLDFYADKKNTFGVLIRGFNLAGESQTTNVTRQTQASNGTLLSTFNTYTGGNNSTHNIAANANWKHVFDSTGKDLNIDFDYSSFQIRNVNDITTQVGSSSYLQNQSVNNPVKFGVFKADYTHPINKDTKLELGAKTSIATIDNYLTFKKANVTDPSRSTDFEYRENINALYGSIQKKIDNWELIAGLRAEQTVATGKDKSVDVLNRSYWQLFPSIFLTRKVTKDFTTGLQYSRRVRRPSYQQQNPFVQYIDSLTYTKGNPLIRPELTDAYKFTLSYQNQPFFSVSYNKTKDVIFNDAPKQEGNLTYTTPENLAAFENLVFELNFPLDFGKKISGYGGNQFILNHYKADYLGGIYNRSKWNWQAYWQVAYKPGAGWNFEVSGFYTTNLLDEFIEISELGSLNIALQKTFADKKTRISLNFNDLLYSQKNRGRLMYQDIDVAFRQVNDTRNVRLSISYAFGNQKLTAARNRSTGSDAEANRVKTN
jgi:hypothetical protein